MVVTFTRLASGIQPWLGQESPRETPTPALPLDHFFGLGFFLV